MGAGFIKEIENMKILHKKKKVRVKKIWRLFGKFIFDAINHKRDCKK